MDTYIYNIYKFTTHMIVNYGYIYKFTTLVIVNYGYKFNIELQLLSINVLYIYILMIINLLCM